MVLETCTGRRSSEKQRTRVDGCRRSFKGNSSEDRMKVRQFDNYMFPRELGFVERPKGNEVTKEIHVRTAE